MYNYKGPFLQIECGKKAFEQFAPKGFWQEESDRRRILSLKIKAIEEDSGMIFPDGCYKCVTTLPAYEFELFFGAFKYQYDVREFSIEELLMRCLREAKLEKYRDSDLKLILENGVEKVLQKNYQEAVYDFHRVYYYASIGGGVYQELVARALSGIALIMWLNGEYICAENYLLTAYERTEAENTYLPRMKYRICCNLGSLFFTEKKYKAAMGYYQRAIKIAAELKDENYLVNSWYYMSCNLLADGAYEQAGTGFENIAERIEKRENQSELVLALERISKECYKLANQALHIKIEELLRENEKLRRDIQKAKTKVSLSDIFSFVLKIQDVLCNIYLMDAIQDYPRITKVQGDVNIDGVYDSKVLITEWGGQS